MKAVFLIKCVTYIYGQYIILVYRYYCDGKTTRTMGQM